MNNFMRKLNQRTCKFKGKLHLKCFKCGKIRYFANKYPLNEKFEHKTKGNYYKEAYPKKKRFYTKTWE